MPARPRRGFLPIDEAVEIEAVLDKVHRRTSLTPRDKPLFWFDSPDKTIVANDESP